MKSDFSGKLRPSRSLLGNEMYLYFTKQLNDYDLMLEEEELEKIKILKEEEEEKKKV